MALQIIFIVKDFFSYTQIVFDTKVYNNFMIGN